MTEIMGQSCFELITVKFVKKTQPFELITVTKWSPEYVLGNLFWKLCACQSAALHWVTAAKVSFKLSSNFPLSDAWVFHPLCYWVPCQGLERFPKITPPIPKMFEDFKGWKKESEDFRNEYTSNSVECQFHTGTSIALVQLLPPNYMDFGISINNLLKLKN